MRVDLDVVEGQVGAEDPETLRALAELQDHPDLVARYSVSKPGARRFLISAKADHP